jgi:hypothetical protein
MTDNKPLSAVAGGHDNASTGNNTERDYITMEDLLQEDTADDDDGEMAVNQ